MEAPSNTESQAWPDNIPIGSTQALKESNHRLISRLLCKERVFALENQT